MVIVKVCGIFFRIPSLYLFHYFFFGGGGGTLCTLVWLCGTHERYACVVIWMVARMVKLPCAMDAQAG